MNYRISRHERSTRHCFSIIFLVCFTLSASLWNSSTRASDNPFSFVAMGDLAYDITNDYDAYAALIETINAAKPTFSVHVGDLGGEGICWNEIREQTQILWQAFEHPLVYTPGDNEWLDCVHQFKPLERLADLRTRFFSQPQTLGDRPFSVERQSDLASERFTDLVENVRFEVGRVLFVTAHVVGSSNGTTSSSKSVVLDALHRTDAAVTWIQSAFNQALAHDNPAVVIVLHAQMFESPTRRAAPPFRRIVRIIQQASEQFKKPVLLVHGDGHRFTIDRVFVNNDNPLVEPRYANITRLQVFGAPAMRAVRVGVDVTTPWVFSFSPIFATSQ